MLWHCKHFSELTRDELYALLKLRAEVFVLEQKDAYLDLDNKDQDAWHFFGWNNDNQLVAYARIYLLDESTISFGRFCIAKSARNKGHAITLLNEIKQWIQLSEYKQLPIKISAQLYLTKFYEQHGFKVISEPYYDSTILHVWMLQGPLE